MHHQQPKKHLSVIWELRWPARSLLNPAAFPDVTANALSGVQKPMLISLAITTVNSVRIFRIIKIQKIITFVRIIEVVRVARFIKVVRAAESVPWIPDACCARPNVDGFYCSPLKFDLCTKICSFTDFESKCGTLGSWNAVSEVSMMVEPFISLDSMWRSRLHLSRLLIMYKNINNQWHQLRAPTDCKL